MNHWARHPHVRTGDQLRFRERAADKLKFAFGTWTLLGLIVGGIVFWLRFVHDPGDLHLNLALSFLASVQGVILQIAANRGDRIASEVALGTHDTARELLKLNQQQMEILGRLDGLDGKIADLAEAVSTVMAARTARSAKTLAKPAAKGEP